MFAYCNNNPVNYIDNDGANSEAIRYWGAGMGWLPFADSLLPYGDIIYYGVLLILTVVTFDYESGTTAEITYDDVDAAYGPPSPNDDDDDDEDDYYDDDDNFGGRQRIGTNKGNAPRNNKAQNKQFRDATEGLTPDQQRIVHDKISGKGLGYHGIKSVVKDLFATGTALYEK